MEIPLSSNKVFNCAILGGGLCCLCLAIQLAQQGIDVILFEKNSYPQHKVCGEYISMESWDFLIRLGVPLHDLNLPEITQLGISSENGFMLNSRLPMGGFGISRYSLDHILCQIARAKGVVVHENCKVLDVENIQESLFEITTSQGKHQAQIVCGSYGKYTPNFAKPSVETPTKHPNYIGVKYHIQTDLVANRIELHNLKDGYCGILKVDNERYCLCYLTKASNLQQSGNDIKAMEHAILCENPFLKKYLTQSTFLFEKPLAISNIYFYPKGTSINGMLMVGDAAGAITPVCGNGMSMAMRASKLLAELLLVYFEGKCTQEALKTQYSRAWASSFNRRIQAGQYIQHLLGKKTSTHLALKTLHYFPAITQKLIGLTHGKAF
ncbi:MAG: oxidoreductase [Saprospiraceae bacterium]|nr:oxidoreductase [Saprospiraceae bacterium]